MFAGIFAAIGGIKTVLIGLAGAAAIAGALYIVHVIKNEGALQAQLDQALETNKQNLLAFDAYKANQEQVLKALAAQHAADQVRLANASKLKQEIAHAKPADDGPVAVVLAHTLDGLRGAQTANPAPH